MAKKTKDNKKIVFKVLKVLLLIVVACIIVFVAHTMRNFFILKDIASKQSDLSHLSSFTIEREGYQDGKLTNIIKVFRLKNKKVTIVVRAGYDMSITSYADLSTGEEVTIFADSKTKQYQKGTLKGNQETNSFGRYPGWDDRTLLAQAIHCFIVSDTVDGKDCYKLVDSYGKGTYECIEKSTGLEIKGKANMAAGDDTYDTFTYNFNRIDESIFELPDLSQYQEIK